jgi:hypothetical protein
MAFGNMVQLTVEGPGGKTYLITLPRQFSVVFTNKDLSYINSDQKWLWITNKGANGNGYNLKLT